MKIAVLGAAGQHGSYMCDLLLEEGHEVWGLVRPHTTHLRSNLFGAIDKGLNLIFGDLLSTTTIHRIATGGFDEIYLFAAWTHIMDSFQCPVETLQVNALAPAMLLEALRTHSPRTRLYFAATSEMLPTTRFGKQNEDGQLGAHSPYAASKVAAYLLCKNYREAFGLHVVCGITFNSESPRRGPDFVTQKIVQGVAKFKRGGPPVQLATISAERDWHHAKDTVAGIRLAMRAEGADTYVFASGVARSVGDWASLVCRYFDVDIVEAINVDRGLARPKDVDYLCGDPTKAETVLGWRRRYSFEGLVGEMCETEEARVHLPE